MTLEQAKDNLQKTLDDFYAVDSSIRHDPLFQEVKRFLGLVQTAIDQAADDDNQAAFEHWYMDADQR